MEHREINGDPQPLDAWLVVWNMAYLFSPTRLGMMIQSDELIFFRGVLKPPIRCSLRGNIPTNIFGDLSPLDSFFSMQMFICVHHPGVTSSAADPIGWPGEHSLLVSWDVWLGPIYGLLMVVVYGLVLIIHHFFGIYLEYIRLVEHKHSVFSKFPRNSKRADLVECLCAETDRAEASPVAQNGPRLCQRKICSRFAQSFPRSPWAKIAAKRIEIAVPPGLSHWEGPEISWNMSNVILSG